MWLMSPQQAVHNLIHGHELDASKLGHTRTISLPGLSVTVRAMVAALERRSEEHTSELQSLMRISYAVFCLKKKKTTIYTTPPPLTLCTYDNAHPIPHTQIYLYH